MKKIAALIIAFLGTSFAVAASNTTPASQDAGCSSCSGGTCSAPMAKPTAMTQAGCCDLLTAYENVSSALAADDLTAATAAAGELQKWAESVKNDALANESAKVVKASSLADARASFKTVSALAIPLAEHAGAHFVMTCPMAKADWIQTTAEVSNPYLGSRMPHCGSIKQTVAATP